MQRSVNIQLAKGEHIRFVANAIFIYAWIGQATVLTNIIQSNNVVMIKPIFNFFNSLVLFICYEFT